MKYKSNLRLSRRQTDLRQQDVAYLLEMDSSTLNKIEKGKRNPSAKIILIYHILFGAKLDELLTEQHVAIAKNIIERSESLIEHIKHEQSPKSKYRIAYLESIVKSIKENCYE